MSTTGAAVPATADVGPAPSQSTAATLRRAPSWIWAGATVIVLLGLAIVAADGSLGEPWQGLAYLIRTAFEGLALLWASRRRDLPRLMRLSFALLGWISIATTSTDLLVAVHQGGGPDLWPRWADRAHYVVSYVAGLAAMVVYPRVPARRGDIVTLSLDSIAAIGVAVLMGTFVTWPLVSTNPDTDVTADVYADAVVTMLNVVGLTLIVLRGQMLPSRRAFWWFVAGQTSYLPMSLVLQFERGSEATPWTDLIYFFGAAVVMAGAVFARLDPIGPRSERRAIPWLRDLNPLPAFVTVVTGCALIVALTTGRTQQVLPLGVSLVVLTMVLAARLLLSLRENAQRLAEEAQERQRHQAEKTDAIGRLAGGIAHEFNNILTIVIGQADLGALEAPSRGATHDSFVAIRAAGERAAALTRQLLQYSGRHVDERSVVDIGQLVEDMAADLRAKYGQGLAVESTPGLLVVADPDRVAQIAVELIEQALRRSSTAGPVRLGVRRLALDGALETPFLVVGAGRYVLISVVDRGRAMTADEVAHLFDPFFAAAPGRQAGSLGMAAVYGIVASHRGGLDVRASADGTAVDVYLPLASS